MAIAVLARLRDQLGGDLDVARRGCAGGTIVVALGLARRGAVQAMRPAVLALAVLAVLALAVLALAVLALAVLALAVLAGPVALAELVVAVAAEVTLALDSVSQTAWRDAQPKRM